MRVVVADDVMITREGIVHLLRGAGFDVVGQAEDLDGLLRTVALDAPDVTIVDIRMPPTDTDEGSTPYAESPMTKRSLIRPSSLALWVATGSWTRWTS
jgi:DNA-binding NarL/FixJ family response regulator